MNLLEKLETADKYVCLVEHLGPFHPDPALSHAYAMARLIGVSKEDAPEVAVAIVNFYKKHATN